MQSQQVSGPAAPLRQAHGRYHTQHATCPLPDIAVIIIEHERGLHVISKRTHLLVAKQVLEQRKDALTRSRVVPDKFLRPLRTRSKTKAEA